MTKEADTEGFSFPDPVELAERSPLRSTRMGELPAQHSPFQRSPILPPACCKRTASINCSQLPVLSVLQHTPVPACPDGDVHTHVQCLAHTHTLSPAGSKQLLGVTPTFECQWGTHSPNSSWKPSRSYKQTRCLWLYGISAGVEV